MKAWQIVLIVVLAVLAVAVIAAICVAIWLRRQQPVGVAAPDTTSTFGVYNMTPLTLYVAYSLSSAVPPASSISYASLQNVSGWITTWVNAYSEPTFLYGTPASLLVYISDDPGCTTFSSWTPAGGGVDGPYECNITLSRNYANAQSIFVQPQNGMTPLQGAGWPLLGIKYLEYNSCEFGRGAYDFGSDGSEPEGATILMGMDCDSQFGSYEPVNPIYASIMVFNGYIPDPTEFTYNTFLTYAANSGNAWNVVLQPNQPIDFPLQPWQTWGNSNSSYPQLNGDLVIVFFYDSDSVGYQSYWTPVTGAVDVATNSLWKVSNLNNLAQNVGVTLISTNYELFPAYTTWNYVSSGTSLLDTFECVARLYSPDGVQIPYFAKSGWIAHNHAYSTYGSTYNAQIQPSIYAPYAPSQDNNNLECCAYTRLLDCNCCYCTTPNLSTYQSSILFATSTVYGMNVVVLKTMTALTKYIGQTSSLKSAELFEDDYALPLLQSSGNIVPIDNQNVAVDALNGPSELNGTGQLATAVLAYIGLLVEAIITGIEDTEIVNPTSNPTSFPSWEQPCGFVAKNNTGIVWSVTDEYDYSGYAAYITSCPGIQYNSTGSDINATSQYQVATWWVEQGRSYNVLSSTTPFAVNGTSSTTGATQLFARYTILEDTTPLCTYYPTAAALAQLTPGQLNNFTSMELMATADDPTLDPLPFMTLPNAIATLNSQQDWWTLNAGASPAVLIYANRSSTRCAAFCYSDGSYAQTFQTNGFQFVLVGTFETGLGLYPYTGPSSEYYSLVQQPYQPAIPSMVYISNTWVGSFNVVSTNGTPYMITNGAQTVYDGASQTNTTWISPPSPGESLIIGLGGQPSSMSKRVPSSFSTMIINSGSYITFS